jgi:hypothetical protein
MNAATSPVRIRMTEKLIAEVLTLAKAGALLDAAKAAEPTKDGWAITFTPEAADELAGYLDAWPSVWDGYARTGELSWGACTALKKSLKAVVAGLAGAFPPEEPAPPAATVPLHEAQEATSLPPEPAPTLPTTPAAPEPVCEAQEAPPAVPAAPAPEPAAPPLSPDGGGMMPKTAEYLRLVQDALKAGRTDAARATLAQAHRGLRNSEKAKLREALSIPADVTLDGWVATQGGR